MKVTQFLISLISTLLISTSSFAQLCDSIKVKGSGYDVGRCKDNTISHQQPTDYKSKEKKSNYEGLCGAVASANAFHAYCDEYFVKPVKIGPKYFSDITPGIRPDTLVSGLNDLFDNHRDKCISGTWHHYYTTNRWDFISRIHSAINSGQSSWIRQTSRGKKKSAPVIVLISKNDGETLHYVTVVDIEVKDVTKDFTKDTYKDDCKVIYNDYKKQKSVSCKLFATWGNQVDNSTWTSWMHEYNYFKFVQ